MQSKKYTLNRTDLDTWAKNAIIFAGPALIVLMGSIANVIPATWKYGAITLYGCNLATDILRKYLDGKAPKK